MRFVWAVAAFVLATVMIGAGIAQRTIFQGPRTETAAISVEDEAPYLLIDGAVLNQLPGTQTLRAQGEGELFASYGRTADMQAWLSDAEYTHVTLGDEGVLDSTLVEPAPDDVAPDDEAAAEDSATDEAAADEAAADAADDAAADDAAAEEAATPGRSPVG